MNKPIIELKNVSKTFLVPHEKRDTLKEHFVSFFNRLNYQLFYALKEVNLTINQGDFFGVIGLNGSGKSTLLKILAGIYQPSKGLARINGSLSPFLELGVGFNGELTGKENVFLNARILGLSQQEIENRYRQIVDFAELKEFMDMKVKNYSSGMYVRLAFSVAIQADADIFLCDEVLAVGDMHFQQKCFEVFNDFKRRGKTVVFVSHDLGSIRQFCNKCGLLERGQLRVTGETEAVLDRYIYGQKTEPEKKLPQQTVETLQGNVSTTKSEITEALPSPLPDCSKKVSFKKVTILNKNNQPTTDIISGQPMLVDIEVNNPDHLGFICGIAFYDESGHHLFGENSKDKHIFIPGTNHLCLEIKHMPILRRKLLITLALHNRHDLSDHYDWLDKKYQIVVHSTENKEGLVNFVVNWQ